MSSPLTVIQAHRQLKARHSASENDGKALNWAEGINSLAEKLSRTLSQLVNEGERFRTSKYSDLFQHLPDTCIHTIESRLEEFTRLQERLKGIVARSEKCVTEVQPSILSL